MIAITLLNLVGFEFIESGTGYGSGVSSDQKLQFIYA
jgi:hypothetical protein